MRQKQLIYGCMGIGSDWNSGSITKEDEKRAFDAILTAVDCGITRFDLADIYCHGKSEELFGRLLKTKPDLRAKIQIQSKAGIELHAGMNKSNTYNFSKDYLISRIEEILKRLHIDYLDMFLLHRPDALTQPEELAETFKFIYDKGYAKSFGVSNMSQSMINLINAYTKIPITANQIQFSLGHSQLINEIVEFNGNTIDDSGLLTSSILNNLEIQAWSPLDKGLYLSRTSENDNPSVKQTKQLLQELSEKYYTDSSALLLAWIMKLPFNIVPIIGTIKPERIKKAAEALKINLSRDDWYNLWISSLGKKLP